MPAGIRVGWRPNDVCGTTGFIHHPVAQNGPRHLRRETHRTRVILYPSELIKVGPYGWTRQGRSFGMAVRNCSGAPQGPMIWTPSDGEGGSSRSSCRYGSEEG